VMRFCEAMGEHRLFPFAGSRTMLEIVDVVFTEENAVVFGLRRGSEGAGSGWFRIS
jgi:hypothetical protein